VLLGAFKKDFFFLRKSTATLGGCLNFIALRRQKYKKFYRGHQGPGDRRKREEGDKTTYLKAKTRIHYI